LPTFLLSRFTRKHVKVALSGDGADELFGGYPTYYAHTLADKYSSFLPYSMLKKLGKLLPVSDNNMSFDFKVNRFVKGLRFDADLRHQVWLGSFDNYELLKLMTPQYKIGHSAYDMPLLRNHMHHCDTEENWERALWQDMRFYLQDNMLVKIDRAAMFNSLEVRVPFLDKRLSQYVMHLPANLKYRGKISKYILKKLAKEYLPEDIINRPKKGFGIPVSQWLRDDLLEMVQEYLGHEHIKEQGIFNPDYVDQLVYEHLRTKQNHRLPLWNLLMFELWYENIFENEEI